MAVAPDDALAHYPLLQFGLVAITFIASAFAIWRGVAAKPAGETIDPTAVALKGINTTLERLERTIDGARVESAATAAATSGQLQGIYRVLNEQRADHGRTVDERNRKFDLATEILRQIDRHTDRPRRT